MASKTASWIRGRGPSVALLMVLGLLLIALPLAPGFAGPALDFLKSEAAPAWFQAILSALAILIAVWLTNLEHARETKAAAELALTQAIGLCVPLLPVVREWRSRISREISKAPAAASFVEASQSVRTLNIVPKEVVDISPELWRTGPPGRYLMKAVHYAQTSTEPFNRLHHEQRKTATEIKQSRDFQALYAYGRALEEVLSRAVWAMEALLAETLGPEPKVEPLPDLDKLIRGSIDMEILGWKKKP